MSLRTLLVLMFRVLFFVFVVASNPLWGQFQTFKTKTKFENLQELDFKKLSWGFWLGVNQFSFDLEPINNSDSPTKARVDDVASSSFSLGLLGELRIHKYVNIVFEPSMHFANRSIIFAENEDVDGLDFKRKVQSTYVGFPISLKFHGVRWGNTMPYIKGGFGYTYNIQSEENSDQDNFDGVFRMTTHNINWQGEMGIDIYFKRFKLTPHVRGVFFINDELVPDDVTLGDPDPYTGTIESLKTRAVIFGLRFQ